MTVVSAPAEAGRKPRPTSSGRRSVSRNSAQARAGLLLSAPFVILFLVFTAWPVVQSMYMSFTDMTRNDVQTPFAVDFIGLENYMTAVGDPVFRKAALNTAIFVVVGVSLTIIAGLAAAVALDKGITKARGFFRLGFYTPVITSIVAVAVVWRFLLQPDFGIVNQMLGAVGIDGPNWIGDQRTALLSLITMAIWRNFGNAMIILLAGLQAVSWQLHEAAAIDGAGTWARFVNVTLPAAGVCVRADGLVGHRGRRLCGRRDRRGRSARTPAVRPAALDGAGACSSRGRPAHRRSTVRPGASGRW